MRLWLAQFVRCQLAERTEGGGTRAADVRQPWGVAVQRGEQLCSAARAQQSRRLRRLQRCLSRGSVVSPRVRHSLWSILRAVAWLSAAGARCVRPRHRRSASQRVNHHGNTPCTCTSQLRQLLRRRLRRLQRCLSRGCGLRCSCDASWQNARREARSVLQTCVSRGQSRCSEVSSSAQRRGRNRSPPEAASAAAT